MNAYLPPSRGPKPAQSELVWVSFYSSFSGGEEHLIWSLEDPSVHYPWPWPQTPLGQALCCHWGSHLCCAIRSPVPPLSEALGVVGPQFPLHNMGLTSVLLAWQGCWETLKGWEKTGGLKGAV